jgi:hypothetical protein
MSVISIDLGAKPINRAAKRWRFRYRLAEWLDALVTYPIKNAVSEQQLRRVDEDIKRCRDLMSNNRRQGADAKLGGLWPGRAIRAVKVR